MATRLFRPGYIATDTAADLIQLYTNVALTATNYQTIFRNGVGYQVTAGKTLYIGKVLLIPGAATGGFTECGYGDSNVNNSAAAPTNPVTNHGPIQGAAAGQSYEFQILWAIPASKFPYIRAAGANPTCAFYGIEI